MRNGYNILTEKPENKRDCSEYRDVDERIILKGTLRKQGVD
jgi:hypothetical protein